MSATRTTDEIRTVLAHAATLGLNVLLEGRHGMGKTALVMEAAEALGLEAKYFSASTLDPFADLVGIPVPILGRRTQKILYLRPAAIHGTELLFFDELNRAHQKVLNAVLEIIQFKTINGERLPRLRSVIAACNPPGAGYDVVELDPALLDRFHLHLRVDGEPDREWFCSQFGDLGDALVNWYLYDLDSKQRDLISSRRLEYIGRAIQGGFDPKLTMPPSVRMPFGRIRDRLKSPGRDALRKKFGECLGDALSDWYESGLDEEGRRIVSRHRLEAIGDRIAQGVDPSDIMPANPKVPIETLKTRVVELGIIQSKFLPSPKVRLQQERQKARAGREAEERFGRAFWNLQRMLVGNFLTRDYYLDHIRDDSLVPPYKQLLQFYAEAKDGSITPGHKQFVLANQNGKWAIVEANDLGLKGAQKTPMPHDPLWMMVAANWNQSY